MSDERLHFDEPATMPHAMTVAEHVARYAMLSPFVRGKRVLDIACGEGYGSWLLKEWGAREVVGVDISADAIAVARKRFGREGVNFLFGDACRAQDFLAHASFDLIVSFETIEHVADPLAFLSGLRSLASPEAAISSVARMTILQWLQTRAIHIIFENTPSRSFRIFPRAFWEEGRSGFLAPMFQGYALIPDGDPATSDIWGNLHDVVKTKPLAVSHLLPSQANIRPDRSNVLYYVGVWGLKETAASAAISAQSYLAFIELSKANDWLKAQLSQVTIGLEEANQRRSNHSSFKELGEAIEFLKTQLPPAKIGLEAVEQSTSTQNLEIHQLCARFSGAVAEARHRVLVLAAQVLRLEGEIRDLQATAARVPLLEGEIRDLQATAARVPLLEGEIRDLQATAARVPLLEGEILNRDNQLATIFQSRSWILTKPVRVVGRLLRGEFRSVNASLQAYLRGLDRD